MSMHARRFPGPVVVTILGVSMAAYPVLGCSSSGSDRSTTTEDTGRSADSDPDRECVSVGGTPQSSVPEPFGLEITGSGFDAYEGARVRAVVGGVQFGSLPQDVLVVEAPGIEPVVEFRRIPRSFAPLSRTAGSIRPSSAYHRIPAVSNEYG